MSELKKSDPELYNSILGEMRRQKNGIELIASENYTSPAVLEAQGSVLTNKYAEGYPQKRYYGGCDYVDIAEKLAIDHIISWSNKNDLIYDPFMGGGTTAVCCKQLDRQWIGSEISKEYYDIIEIRLFNTHMQFNLF